MRKCHQRLRLTLARVTVLVIGGSGQLGRALVAAAGSPVAATYLTDQVRTGPDWYRLDVRDRAEVRALLARLRPEVVINAAYRQSEWASTADGAATVALAAADCGARLVHVSSDVVFSGTANPYVESDPPAPVTPYGAAKAAAETAISALLPTAVIARTSLIVGHAGDSPTEQLVHRLVQGEPGGLFTDEIRCPVHVRDLAAALLELARADLPGIWHLVGADALSRHALGELIARRDGLDPDLLRRTRRADTVPGPLELRLRSTRQGLSTRMRGAREFLAPWPPMVQP